MPQISRRVTSKGCQKLSHEIVACVWSKLLSHINEFLSSYLSDESGMGDCFPHRQSCTFLRRPILRDICVWRKTGVGRPTPGTTTRLETRRKQSIRREARRWRHRQDGVLRDGGATKRASSDGDTVATTNKAAGAAPAPAAPHANGRTPDEHRQEYVSN